MKAAEPTCCHSFPVFQRHLEGVGSRLSARDPPCTLHSCSTAGVCRRRGRGNVAPLPVQNFVPRTMSTPVLSVRCPVLLRRGAFFHRCLPARPPPPFYSTYLLPPPSLLHALPPSPRMLGFLFFLASNLKSVVWWWCCFFFLFPFDCFRSGCIIPHHTRYVLQPAVRKTLARGLWCDKRRRAVVTIICLLPCIVQNGCAVSTAQ